MIPIKIMIEVQENKWYRCDIKVYWSRTYPMLKHLFDLYQAH